MNTDGNDLKHYEITRSVIGSFYQVYRELGRGCLEPVYVEALSLVLRAEGLSVHRGLPIKVNFRGRLRFDNAFEFTQHRQPSTTQASI